MSRTLLASALVLTSACATAPLAAAPIKAADFPTVSGRAVFFEERINAEDAASRLRLLTEVSYFFHLPDREYVSFLKRLTRDADPVVRGRAVQALYNLWVPIDPKDLPRRFAGFHDRHPIDLDNKDTFATLLAECGKPSAEAGWAAYVLGLLRRQEAVPTLKKLADHPNIFVRYTAARSLLTCGDPASARPILEAIIRSQLDLYAAQLAPAPAGRAESVNEKSPYYAATACRTFMELGPEQKKEGLRKLITLLGRLEVSRDPNDEGNVPFVQQMLAAVTGKYFLTSAQAREWYTQKHGGG